MKRLLLLFILFGSIAVVNAQAPQFAVVRPDGTTYICPSWDSAYNKAINGDYVYLPGGSIGYTNDIISKKLFIYGAGHHPDSSAATGITTLTGNLRIAKGADEGLLEGVNVTGNIQFGLTTSMDNRANVHGYTIKRCRFNSLFMNTSLNPNTFVTDSLPQYLMITENIFSNSIITSGTTAINNNFTKNIIVNAIAAVSYSTFSNNIFLLNVGSPAQVVYCNFNNNIFCTGSNLNQCTCNFTNNIKVGNTSFINGCAIGDGSEVGNIIVNSTSEIFLSYTGSGSFLYSNNFHLQPTCPGINAGTDGTDVGIYGTTTPTPIGWVPSNPHIYFKQVASQTNTSGQLPVQFKVRTGN
jgi:hypothetical protein